MNIEEKSRATQEMIKKKRELGVKFMQCYTDISRSLELKNLDDEESAQKFTEGFYQMLLNEKYAVVTEEFSV